MGDMDQTYSTVRKKSHIKAKGRPAKIIFDVPPPEGYTVQELDDFTFKFSKTLSTAGNVYTLLDGSNTFDDDGNTITPKDNTNKIALKEIEIYTDKSSPETVNLTILRDTAADDSAPSGNQTDLAETNMSLESVDWTKDLQKWKTEKIMVESDTASVNIWGQYKIYWYTP